MSKVPKQQPNDGEPNLAGKLFDALAPVASVMVGAKVAKTAIKDFTFQKYKEEPQLFFLEERNLRRQDSAQQLEELHKLQQLERTPEILKKVQEKFDEALDRRFKEFGFKNQRHYWGALDENKRNTVLERAFTAGGITLGVLLTVANSKTVGRFLTHHDKDKSAQTR